MHVQINYWSCMCINTTYMAPSYVSDSYFHDTGSHIISPQSHSTKTTLCWMVKVVVGLELAAF